MIEDSNKTIIWTYTIKDRRKDNFMKIEGSLGKVPQKSKKKNLL
jgi:hypothetical protein